MYDKIAIHLFYFDALYNMTRIKRFAFVPCLISTRDTNPIDAGASQHLSLEQIVFYQHAWA